MGCRGRFVQPRRTGLLTLAVLGYGAAADGGPGDAGVAGLITGPREHVLRAVETEQTSSGAVFKFLWLAPQGSASPPYPEGTTGVGTDRLQLTGLPEPSQPLWLGMFFSGWGPVASDGRLRSWQAALDNSSLQVSGGNLRVWRPSCPGGDDAICLDLVGEGAGSGCNVDPIVDDTCAPAFIDESRGDHEHFGLETCRIFTNDLSCLGSIEAGEKPHPDPGGDRYGSTLVLEALPGLLPGPYKIRFLPPDGTVVMEDGNGQPILVKTVPAELLVLHGAPAVSTWGLAVLALALACAATASIRRCKPSAHE